MCTSVDNYIEFNLKCSLDTQVLWYTDCVFFFLHYFWPENLLQCCFFYSLLSTFHKRIVHTEESFRNLVKWTRNQIVFGTKRMFVWFQFNWCMVNTIWLRFDLIRFQKDLSVCTYCFCKNSNQQNKNLQKSCVNTRPMTAGVLIYLSCWIKRKKHFRLAFLSCKLTV